MARPSKGDRTSLTIRLSPARLAEIDAFAQTSTLDRNSAIDALIGRGLVGRFAGGVATTKPEPVAMLHNTGCLIQKRVADKLLPPRQRTTFKGSIRGFDAVTGEPIYG